MCAPPAPPGRCVDRVGRRRHNGEVRRAVARFAALVAVGPVLLSGSGLAPLHAHESDSGHAHALVHSHFEPHHAAHDSGSPEIEPGEHVVWLNNPFLHAVPYQFHVVAEALTVVVDVVTHPRSWSVIAFDEAAPPHGPPRSSTSLRAPPYLPV